MTEFKILDELTCWYQDDEPIFIKAVTKEGDPVELNCDEAKHLIEALTKFVNQIEQQDFEADLKRESENKK